MIKTIFYDDLEEHHMAKSASTPGRRFMKLAGMTASIATKTVSSSIRNLTADDEQKLATKDKKNNQYVITKEILLEFIKNNEELSTELHKFRGH